MTSTKIIPTTKEETKSSSIARSPDVSLRDVVFGLLNSSRNVVLASGEEMPRFPPELVTMGRALFPAGREYKFEIHSSTIIGTNGAGAMNGNIDWNPGVTSYSEWTALAALFNEVCLESTMLEITSALTPASALICPMVVIAPSPSATGGTTFAICQRLAESKMFHPYLMGSSGSVGRLVRKYKITRGSRPFATTATPAPAGPPSGCFGYWAYATDSAGTISSSYLHTAQKSVIILRNRA